VVELSPALRRMLRKRRGLERLASRVAPLVRAAGGQSGLEPGAQPQCEGRSSLAETLRRCDPAGEASRRWPARSDPGREYYVHLSASRRNTI